MCTEHSPDAITVCDIAIDDVRTALAGETAISYEAGDREGTTVTNSDPSARGRFRAKLGAALALHGGRLKDAPPS